jgi:D-glycero-D-manno-heptose 1,7-bisphosphate phosphatase
MTCSLSSSTRRAYHAPAHNRFSLLACGNDTPRCVVLDRDGTLIVERHYLSEPDQVELISGVISGLRQLSEMGLGLVVVTNQSGIGRGLFDLIRLDLIHRRLCELLAAEGVHLEGIYVCPHTPEDDCLCRKPRIGLIELAAKELNFDPRTTFIIGDKSSDIELGKRVGATTFLVRTGYGAQVAADPTVNPDYVVDGVWEAAQVIERLLTIDERRATDAVRP